MECLHIPIIGYGEFSKRLHANGATQRIPLKGSIELTARCNLRCSHCYINLPEHDRGALENELSRKELHNLLDQVVCEGCLWMLFTGGEPLLRHDFIEVYTYAKRKGLLITLFTNGTLITPAIADHLAEWRPFVVEITLYGRTQWTYERITGVAGSYARCMEGINLLLERKVPLKLKTMVMTLNRHEIQDIKAYAKELGVDFRIDPILNLRLDGNKKPESFRISPEEVVAIDMSDEGRSRGLRDLCARSIGPPLRKQYLYQCGAGEGLFHIDPQGKLSACIMSREPNFDLRMGNFYEGWHNFMPTVRSRKRTRNTPCSTCDIISLCGHCPGVAQNETGDPELHSGYLCRIAHLRAEAFGAKNRR
jgi:radical SAM protein with 4Fe4S-binding SPASM domain